MTYNPAIPQASDNPSASQPQILANFNQLNVQFSQDHIPFTASSNNGYHNKVTWLNQSSDPSPLTGAIIAYSKISSGISSSYYERDGLSTVFPLAPIKAYASINVTSAVAATILDGFNLSIGVGVAGVYPVTITRAMKSANYGILFGVGQVSTIGPAYSNQTTTTFNLKVTPGFSSPYPLLVTVALLEF